MKSTKKSEKAGNRATKEKIVRKKFSAKSKIEPDILNEVVEGDRITGKSVEYPISARLSSGFSLINELKSNRKSNIVIHELIERTGLPSKVIAENVFEISLKTLHNYKNSEKILPVKFNEHAIKLRELYKKGEEVFGSNSNFRNWVNSRSYGLNNSVPLDLFNTITGIDLINEELLRIEFGTPI